MGFRQGAYMTIWSFEDTNGGNFTKVRASTSKKNKKTNEYEQDFSGYCMLIGNAHTKAGKLKEKDRIKIVECEVTTSYNKEKKVEYVNYKVYDFETVNNDAADDKKTKKTAAIEEGELDEDEDLPF